MFLQGRSTRDHREILLTPGRQVILVVLGEIGRLVRTSNRPGVNSKGIIRTGSLNLKRRVTKQKQTGLFGSIIMSS